MVEVRIEQPEDIDAVRLLNNKTFGHPAEGLIVDKLRPYSSYCEEMILVDEQETSVTF